MLLALVAVPEASKPERGRPLQELEKDPAGGEAPNLQLRNDEPRDNQVFCRASDHALDASKAVQACVREPGFANLVPAGITTDGTSEMIARGESYPSLTGARPKNCPFLVDGYASGGPAVSMASRNPKQKRESNQAKRE